MMFPWLNSVPPDKLHYRTLKHAMTTLYLTHGMPITTFPSHSVLSHQWHNRILAPRASNRSGHP